VFLGADLLCVAMAAVDVLRNNLEAPLESVEDNNTGKFLEKWEFEFTPSEDTCNAYFQKWKNILNNCEDVNSLEMSGASGLVVFNCKTPLEVLIMVSFGIKSVSANTKQSKYDTNYAMIKLLLERGFNCKYSDGPLVMACEDKRVGFDLVKLLIDHGADVNDIRRWLGHGYDENAHADKNETPLSYAVKSKRKYLIKLLIESGADVQASPVRLAFCKMCHGGFTNIVKQLRQAGMPLNFACIKDIVLPGITFPMWVTPLICSIKDTSSMILVTYLLEQGADPNYVPEKAMRSPLGEAMRLLREDVLLELLRFGADPLLCDEIFNAALERVARCRILRTHHDAPAMAINKLPPSGGMMVVHRLINLGAHKAVIGSMEYYMSVVHFLPEERAAVMEILRRYENFTRRQNFLMFLVFVGIVSRPVAAVTGAAAVGGKKRGTKNLESDFAAPTSSYCSYARGPLPHGSSGGSVVSLAEDASMRVFQNLYVHIMAYL
jgi:hypothetical protein